MQDQQLPLLESQVLAGTADAATARSLFNVGANYFADHHLIDPNHVQLYNAEPEKINIDCVGIALLNALSTSSSDFLAAAYLIPSSVESTASVSTILKLSVALESCKIAEFWSMISSSSEVKSLIVKIPDFNSNIRQFIYQLVASSFSTIKASVLKQYWNCSSDDEFVGLLAIYSLKAIDGLVQLPVSSSSKSSVEQPSFELVAKSLRQFL